MVSILKKIFGKKEEETKVTTGDVFIGPTRPETSVEIFRKTGASVPVRSVVGRKSVSPKLSSQVLTPQQQIIQQRTQAEVVSPRRSLIRRATQIAQERLRRKALFPSSPLRIKEILRNQRAFKRKVLPVVREGADIISGGALTQKEFRKAQEQINKDVESFNNKFGGKELFESQYNQALKDSETLSTRQVTLEQTQKEFEKTGRAKFGKRFFKPITGEVGKVRESKIGKRFVKIHAKIEEGNARRLQNKLNKELKSFEKKPTKPKERRIKFFQESLTKSKERVSLLKEGRQAFTNFSVFDLVLFTLPLGRIGRLFKGKIARLFKGKKVGGVIKKTKLGGLKLKPDQVKKIITTRKRFNEFNKLITGKLKPTKSRLKKFNFISKKDFLEVQRRSRLRPGKIVSLKPSRAKIRRIKIVRKRLAKFRKATGEEAKILKFNKEKLKKIKATRKRLIEFEKQFGTKKKLAKFKKEKLKVIKRRRNKLLAFQKKLGTQKKLRKFEKQKLKQIIKRRKLFRKFQEKIKGSKSIRQIQENIKQLERERRLKIIRRRLKKARSPKAIRRIQRIPVQRIRLRKKVPKKIRKVPSVSLITKQIKPIQFKVRKLSSIRDTRQAQVLVSPQTAQEKIRNAVQRMSPQQRAKFSRALKDTLKKIVELKFKRNNNLIKLQRKLAPLSNKAVREGFQRSLKKQVQLTNKFQSQATKVKKVRGQSFKLNQQFKSIQKPSLKQKQKFNQRQKLISKQLKAETISLRNVSRSLTRSIFASLSLSASAQISRQAFKISPRFAQPQRLAQPLRAAQSQRIKPLRVTKQISGLKVLQARPTRAKGVLFFGRGKKETKTLKKAVPTFEVLLKVKKKFVKVSINPLVLKDALDKGSFVGDNSTGKTFKLKPLGKRKKVGSIRKIERNYFKRAGFKFRQFKIRKGRKFVLSKKYIENRRFGIDTRGEVKGLSVAKYVKDVYGKRKVKRKLTPSQRKVMLKNLKKARMVLKKKKGDKR